jgi:hypothetical protein
MSKEVNQPVDKYMRSIDNEVYPVEASSWLAMEHMLTSAEANSNADISLAPKESLDVSPFFFKYVTWCIFLLVGTWLSSIWMPLSLTSPADENFGMSILEDKVEIKESITDQINIEKEVVLNKETLPDKSEVFHSMGPFLGEQKSSNPSIVIKDKELSTKNEQTEDDISVANTISSIQTSEKLLPKLDSIPLEKQIQSLAKPNKDSIAPQKKKFLFW